MAVVEGVGTRRSFPYYIAHRPALALWGCKQLGDLINHLAAEGRELPIPVPPFGVLMYIEMMSMLQELAPEGVIIQLAVPDEVARWIR